MAHTAITVDTQPPYDTRGHIDQCYAVLFCNLRHGSQRKWLSTKQTKPTLLLNRFTYPCLLSMSLFFFPLSLFTLTLKDYGIQTSLMKE